MTVSAPGFPQLVRGEGEGPRLVVSPEKPLVLGEATFDPAQTGGGSTMLHSNLAGTGAAALQYILSPGSHRPGSSAAWELYTVRFKLIVQGLASPYVELLHTALFRVVDEAWLLECHASTAPPVRPMLPGQARRSPAIAPNERSPREARSKRSPLQDGMDDDEVGPHPCRSPPGDVVW